MASSGRDQLLRLHDEDQSGKRFERFCLDLVLALPDVRDAHLYGVPGDDQEGIDIHADLVDGRVRSIQCRRVKGFIKTDAAALIAGTSYGADEYRLWCTCGVSAGARNAFRVADGWDAWDLEQISSAVRALPREVARWIVEDHLGSEERKRFLGPSGDLALEPALRWFQKADDLPAALRTNQTLRGRATLVGDVLAVVDSPLKRVAVIAGPGGIGKTRILRELAEHLHDRRVLLLRDGINPGHSLFEEIPDGRFVLLIDDAHRRDDLPTVLAAIATYPEANVVLGTRPQRLDRLRTDLLRSGVPLGAVVELDPLVALTAEDATALAEDELDAEHQGAARALADATRDVPALCVLGARLINDGELTRAELLDHDATRRDILARFRDELVGQIADDVDPDLVRHLLLLLAAHQPLDLSSTATISWLSTATQHDEIHVMTAIRRMIDAGLVDGRPRKRRVTPDVLGDFVLREACVSPDGTPTGIAEQLVAGVPEWAVGSLLANLAELDWKLGAAGEPRVLDDVRAQLRQAILATSAHGRTQLLERLKPSAIYMAGWIVDLARDLLDSPAEPDSLYGLDAVDDDDVRVALGPLLRDAAYSTDRTAWAMHLLWEAGRDLEARSTMVGEGPTELLARFADYQHDPHYTAALLGVVSELSLDTAEAEQRRVQPLRLLEGLTRREGTTSRRQGWEVALSGYQVNASATRALRDQLRALLSDRCQNGGPRARTAAAALLGDMLRQPMGRFGECVSAGELAQWRPEQLVLIDDIGQILRSEIDPLVSARLRDDVGWHVNDSAIYGVKTRVRRLLKAHPPTIDEQLIRALTHRLSINYDDPTPRLRKLADTLAAEATSAANLLDRVDRACLAIQQTDRSSRPDAGPILAALAERDTRWSIAAANELASSPDRPSAQALGVVLTVALSVASDDVRALLPALTKSPDPRLRRFAADYVSRMAWVPDQDAPEREAAVLLAADIEADVVARTVQVAERLPPDEHDLARGVVLAVIRGRHAGALAEQISGILLGDDRGRVSTANVQLSDAEIQEALDQLVEAPAIGFWQARLLRSLSRREPHTVAAYLLRRVARPYATNYRAVPFDGFRGDLLETQETARRAILSRILSFAANADDAVFDSSLLFWAYANRSPEALDVLGERLLLGPPRDAEVAYSVLDDAPHSLVLSQPTWISAQLEQVPVDRLDPTRSALHSALTCGMKQGSPGQPFPRDVELRDRAAEYETVARAGSRTAAFWAAVRRSAEREIQDALATHPDDD